MKQLFPLTVVLLSACTTYSERQESSPWHVVSSERSLREYEACITPLMRDVDPSLTSAPEGNSVVITFPVQNVRYVLATVTIRPHEEGVKAELRSSGQRGPAQKFAAIMDGCR